MRIFIMVIISIVLGTATLPTYKKPSLQVEVTDPYLFTTQVAKDIKPVANIKLQQPDTVATTTVVTPVLPDTPPVVDAKTSSAAPLQSGTCREWMAAAGITDTENATRLLNWESHCNAYAVNPSSGACGLAQELPCGKSGCSLGDGACQMKWFNQYVLSRYGSMAIAVTFHINNGWY